jgi:hypothetical protein
MLPSGLSLIMIGLLTGSLSGLFGVGGGFLLVPLLSLIGWPMPIAIGTSLFYVCVVSVAGAIAHYRRGNLDLRLVGLLSAPMVLGTLIGAYLTHLTPVRWLDLAFALVVGYAGWQLLHGQSAIAEAAPSGGAGRAAGLGGTVGLLSGLLGVGGGVLLVPGQMHWLGVPLKRAIGNSLAAVVLTGASGALTHFALGHLDWRGGVWLIAGGMAGMRVGLRLLKRVVSERLRLWFAGMLFALALVMAGRGLMAMLGPSAG